MATESSKNPGTKKFGHYTIIKQLGKGGMGQVYEAYEEALDRTVAIKILNKDLSKDSQFKARFIKEARTAAKLEHQNIATVYSVGEINSLCYIAMQHIKGMSLAEHITKNGTLSHIKALNILKQTSRAVSFAHKQGIVHRDLKPGNIMLTTDGVVKVMDFGLAKELKSDSKMTETGTYLGTPEYSSPEQCEGGVLDGKSDIYSLGVVLYEMITGKMPYTGDTPYALFSKIINDPPPDIRTINPDVPEPVAQLIDEMLSKNGKDRPSADELITIIDDILENRPVRRRKPVSTRRRKSGALRFAGAAAAILILIALAVIIVSKKNDAPNGQNPAITRHDSTDTVKTAVAIPPAPSVKNEFPKVILVLDSQNTTGEADINWLRTAIPEMLATDLSDCQYLKLISRDILRKKMTSSGPIVELNSIPDSILKELDASLIITSSFMRTADLLAVDIKVYELPAGNVIAAAKSENVESKIFSLIDDLSSKIIMNMDKKLGQGALVAFTDKSISERLFAADAKEKKNLDGQAKMSMERSRAQGFINDDENRLIAVKMFYEAINESEEYGSQAGDLAFEDMEDLKGNPSEKNKNAEINKDVDKTAHAGLALQEKTAELAGNAIPAVNAPPVTPQVAIANDKLNKTPELEGQSAEKASGAPGNSDKEQTGFGTREEQDEAKTGAEPALQKQPSAPATPKEALIRKLEEILAITPDFMPAKKKLEELKRTAGNE
ncbi:MAG: serine/threonine protein kinase [Planctomycetes bacterium]|nr:serine/threonine protein kinase [Planctomycetota bacterium]